MKAPDVLKKFSPELGNELHAIQLNIGLRGPLTLTLNLTLVTKFDPRIKTQKFLTLTNPSPSPSYGAASCGPSPSPTANPSFSSNPNPFAPGFDPRGHQWFKQTYLTLTLTTAQLYIPRPTATGCGSGQG